MYTYRKYVPWEPRYIYIITVRESFRHFGVIGTVPTSEQRC